MNNIYFKSSGKNISSKFAFNFWADRPCLQTNSYSFNNPRSLVVCVLSYLYFLLPPTVRSRAKWKYRSKCGRWDPAGKPIKPWVEIVKASRFLVNLWCLLLFVHQNCPVKHGCRSCLDRKWSQLFEFVTENRLVTVSYELHIWSRDWLLFVPLHEFVKVVTLKCSSYAHGLLHTKFSLSHLYYLLLYCRH